MTYYDIFNGDADGLCALRQLRLHDRRETQIVTGAKRDIALVERIRPRAGDRLTILDVSFDQNRAAVLHALDAGASCLYFDHHYPGAIPAHPRLEAHIRYIPGICTSLIVDDFLGGRYRAWAVTGAFGDNLPEQAEAAARLLQLDGAQLATLRTLGECLNYNAYGDTVEDLHFPPAELYRRLAAFADPLEFAAQDPAFGTLQRGYQQDMALAAAADPLESTSAYHVTIFPDKRWSRRASGAWANRLAAAHPHRAHAVLVRRSTHFSVSVRAPIARPTGADELCRRFGGSGRLGAAGIDRLPLGELRRFVTEFARTFADGATSP